MKRTLSIAFVVLLFLAVMPAAFAGGASDMLVTTSWLAEHQKDANLVLLHVAADPKVYETGHIPGARYISMSVLSVTRNGVANQTPAPADIQKALEEVGVSDDTFVIASGDGPLFATHLDFLLDYIGHKRHAVLDGGIHTWKFEKRELSTAIPAAAARGKLTVTPHPELLTDFATVEKMVAEKKGVLIDSRPPDHFSGATAGADNVKRPGHIPGAKSVPWTTTLASTNNPVFKSAADLRAMFEAAGAKADTDNVIYCRTGMMAKNGYFTMKLAGLRARVYDGSFTEWSNVANTVVVTGNGT